MSDNQLMPNIPASEKLVEKISSAIGILYDPYGIKKGQRDFNNNLFNEIIQNNELTPQEKIAVAQECRLLIIKNNNRKTILNATHSKLTDTAKPEEIEDSWLFSFWDKAGQIFDKELQKIWSDILAKQANEPNSISKRLLHNLSLMSSEDARKFSNLTRFCFDDFYSDLTHPLIYIKDHPLAYKDSNITAQILKELEMFSLVEINYEFGFAFNKKKVLKYREFVIEISGEKINAGNVKLTEDGQRLYKILQGTEKKENHQIFEYTVEQLQYNNCNVIIDKMPAIPH